MKKNDCSECNKEFPMDDLYYYKDKSYCSNCIEPIINENEIKEGDITRIYDPTICKNCKLDTNEELPTLLNIPICHNCYSFFMNRPFPLWIKIFSVVVILLVIGGLFFNLNYFQSYLLIKKANVSFSNYKYEEAYQNAKLASEKVNNLTSVRTLRDLYEGMYYFSTQKYNEALPLLKEYKKYNSSDTYIEFIIMSCESSLAFDNKDFQSFYYINLNILDIYKNDPFAMLGAASGAACMYATSNDTKYKNESVGYLKKVEAYITPQNKDQLMEYIQRIKHRLFSEKIIDRDEYYKIFPNGWQGDVE
ncbi:MAG: hypothetical protein A2086_15665 [Spirochaetes bacterium GWD1_27_9]|nr:MAG: hypothetical protein A2Z98_14180 [Spirochaetes bacterium GWB1_27_13]OHD22482.1 MAG: hypothetical protein A2Y34_06685 [Spirochaetes bacterium GWC1_27_15]OHD42819.1 MAG: hypothetical protein A2086_15665 [Spirochaetes bacterium GWD1_27_9]